jgi:hypothetical protein
MTLRQKICHVRSLLRRCGAPCRLRFTSERWAKLYRRWGSPILGRDDHLAQHFGPNDACQIEMRVSELKRCASYIHVAHLVIHEAAHHFAGEGHGHDEVWRDEFLRLCQLLKLDRVSILKLIVREVASGQSLPGIWKPEADRLRELLGLDRFASLSGRFRTKDRLWLGY